MAQHIQLLNPIEIPGEAMAWGRMDDGFDDHPKVVAILDEEDQALAGVAVGVWTLCWAWAHRNTRKPGKTPGLVPPGLPRRFLGSVGRKSVELLVKHGLWHEHESGGWVFHDFADYLPTESTRDARSEAGKRGAAARWGKRDDAGNVGITPDQDGNLPSACRGVDSNEVANDGSRAPARRDPTPTPTPIPTPTEEHPKDVLFGEHEAGTAEPAKRKRGRVPREESRISEDFTPNDRCIKWAGENVPLVDISRETPKFVDYWLAATKNEIKKDWYAAWRTWMRNAQERAEQNRRNLPVQQPRQPGLPARYEPRVTAGYSDRHPQRPLSQSSEGRNYDGWTQDVKAQILAEMANGGDR